MSLARHYSRVVRFGASHETVAELLGQMQKHAEHREPGAHHRLVTADALDEVGRGEEADILRNHPDTVNVHGGVVRKSSQRLDDAFRRYREAAGDHHDINIPADADFRFDISRELVNVGRHDEAILIRQMLAHPVSTAGDVVAPAYVHHAWPGGYPLIHLHAGSDSVFCADCANDFARRWAASRDRGRFSAGGLQSEPHYEGPPVECDSCGKQIESAYGYPDEETGDAK